MLRFARLGSQSLWIDEIFTWQNSGIGTRLSLADLLENVHGPLFALVTHAWCALAGGSEAALRAPSAVAGVLTVPAMAWLADRWLGRSASGWAAWLAAGSPFLVWYSQEARPYSMLMLLVCVTGSLVLGAARSDRARDAALAGGGILGGLGVAFAFAMVLPVYARWWLADPASRGRRLRAAAVLAAAAALISLPWLPSMLSTWDWRRLAPGHHAPAGEEALRGATTFHPAAVPYALHVFAVGYSLGPSPRELRADPSARTLRRHLPGIAVTAIVFGSLGALALAAARRRRRLLDVVAWIVLPMAVVSWFALANFKVFHPRYLAVCAPPMLALMAAALADLAPRPRVILASLVGALWALSLWHLAFDPRDRKEDHRGALALVASRAVAGEKLLAVNCRDVLDYYPAGRAAVVTFWLGYAADSARLEAKMDQAMPADSAAWVVESRPEDQDPAGRFARRMDARVPPADRFEFTGVRVWYVRPAAARGAGAR